MKQIPRRIAMKLCREKNGAKLQKIAKVFKRPWGQVYIVAEGRIIKRTYEKFNKKSKIIDLTP